MSGVESYPCPPKWGHGFPRGHRTHHPTTTSASSGHLFRNETEERTLLTSVETTQRSLIYEEIKLQLMQSQPSSCDSEWLQEWKEKFTERKRGTDAVSNPRDVLLVRKLRKQEAGNFCPKSKKNWKLYLVVVIPK
jgi:hypothetical protein